MLTLHEGRGIFKALRFYSDLCILPLDVNVETGKILCSKLRHKLLIYYIFLTYHGVLATYQTGRLVQVLLDDSLLIPFHFPVHVATCAAVCINWLWSFPAFVLYPDDMVGLFNKLFSEDAGRITKAVVICKVAKMTKFAGFFAITGEERRRHIYEMSLQELMSLALPFLIVSLATIVTTVNVVDTSMIHLLYSLVGTEYSNWLTLIVSLFLDSWVIVMSCATCLFILTIHGLLTQMLSSALEAQILTYEGLIG